MCTLLSTTGCTQRLPRTLMSMDRMIRPSSAPRGAAGESSGVSPAFASPAGARAAEGEGAAAGAGPSPGDGAARARAANRATTNAIDSETPRKITREIEATRIRRESALLRDAGDAGLFEFEPPAHVAPQVAE